MAQSDKEARRFEREIVVTLKLPRDLHARLQELGGPRGLTREVRERLEASLVEAPAVDDETQRLLRAVANLAGDLATSYGVAWYADQYVANLFKDAICELTGWATSLLDAKPAEPKTPNPGSVAARVLEGDPNLDIGGFLGTRAATLEGFL